MTAAALTLPKDHSYRQELNDEVHARPPEPMRAPMRASYLVCVSSAATKELEVQAINDLADKFGVAPPAHGASHYSADLGPIRVKWERHTEFTGYTFLADGLPEPIFSEPAITLVPDDWLAALPGEVLLAAHIALIDDGGSKLDHDRLAKELFGGNAAIGAGVADGSAMAMTDFRIHSDGFSRLLISNGKMTSRQAGRMVQRLLEIDSYRMMALLALPTARTLWPFLTRCEQELVRITTALTDSDVSDELRLLNRLTQLQADIESRYANNNYRFDAAKAYYALVQRRIVELRESRIQGLQTFREFTERRLAPAMDTCAAVAERQNTVSQGVARATQLLSTRVDMARREQNQAVLESMDRRAGLQLRLQEAVEALSVVAVTYYIVGLVGYAGDGLYEFGLPIDPKLIKGISIPLVAATVFLVLRRIRKLASGNMES